MKFIAFLVVISAGLLSLDKARAVCCPAAAIVWSQTHDSKESSAFYGKCTVLRGVVDKIPWPMSCLKSTNDKNQTKK